MYACVVSELKTKMTNADEVPTEPLPARVIYDDVDDESSPPVPLRQLPPVPKPRLVPIRPAPLPPQRAARQKTAARPSAPSQPTPQPQPQEPVSLPVWSWVPEVVEPNSEGSLSQSSPNHVSTTQESSLPSSLMQNRTCIGDQELVSPVATGIKAVTEQLADMFADSRTCTTETPPEPGWVVSQVAVPSRRHSADDSSSVILEQEPDESTSGCSPIGFGGLFRAARKKTSQAVQAVNKKLDPPPRPNRRPVQREETRYAVSSDLLRELAAAESAPSNGRYIVGKELLSELLEAAAKPPPPSAPPLDLVA